MVEHETEEETRRRGAHAAWECWNVYFVFSPFLLDLWFIGFFVVFSENACDKKKRKLTWDRECTNI